MEKVFGVGLLMFGTCGLAWSQVPIDREPRHHIVFQHETLRVLDVNVPSGDVTLAHTHYNDLATVCIGNSETRTREPGTDWSPVRVRAVGQANVTEYSGKPGTHEVKNTGSGLYRVIGIENLRQRGWPESVPASGPATEMVNETRAFRIYDVRLQADRVETSHTHSIPVVVVLVTGKVAETGNTRRLEQPGDWLFIPAGGSHRVKRDGTDPVHVVEIEAR
jgi:quercetin dioxygenase-like cupin family protein